jgi:hypothetical protein
MATKGNELGFVYMPYIMVQTTPIIYGITPKNVIRMARIKNIFFGEEIKIEYTNYHPYLPKMSIKSRYATKMVNNKFYGKIEIK